YDSVLALFASDMFCVVLFFFFQAEDGIRDWSVTGVQTCALPISRPPGGQRLRVGLGDELRRGFLVEQPVRWDPELRRALVEDRRSEERRVGKEGRSRWAPYH